MKLCKMISHKRKFIELCWKSWKGFLKPSCAELVTRFNWGDIVQRKRYPTEGGKHATGPYQNIDKKQLITLKLKICFVLRKVSPTAFIILNHLKHRISKKCWLKTLVRISLLKEHDQNLIG